MRKRNYLINDYTVPVIFAIICAIGIWWSGFSMGFISEQVLIRFIRNAFLVLALIIPIMSGLGINFAMVLGAMAGQIGLIVVENFQISGMSGVLLAILISLPIAFVLGKFAGGVLNRAKGREMITSMILGFFITGVYQIVVLYIFGGLIPFGNKKIMLSRGYGVRNSIELSTKNGIDMFLDRIIGTPINIFGVHIPIMTIVFIILGCLFVTWFRKTKLGQDMRAVGQDMKVANDAGIDVNKTRSKAIVISTIMAAIGQIIYLQNIGTLNTYNGSDQAAVYASAALLIGGASVSKANVKNALIGTALFHLMFIVMPTAGTNITGNSMIGEYLRTFISYAVVTITLIIHSTHRANEELKEMEEIQIKEKKEA